MTDGAKSGVNRMQHEKAGSDRKKKSIRPSSGQQRDKSADYTCYRCGYSDHSADDCGARHTTCLYCKKTGHLARVCKKKQRDGPSSSESSKKSGKRDKKPKRVRAVDVLGDDDSTSSDESLFYIDSTSSASLRINNQRLKMIIDSGSERNIISASLYRRLFHLYKLKSTNKSFIAYGQKKPLKCLGYFIAEISVQNKTVTDRIYVIDAQAESLIGRKSSIELELISYKSENLNAVTEEVSLTNLITEYKDIFSGLGKVQDFQYQVTVDKSLKPVAQKLRRIPYAMIEPVNMELDRMME